MSAALPTGLAELAARSAAPDSVAIALRRMVEERPEVIGRLVEGGTPTPLARALVVVGAASNSLGRVWLVDDGALDVLEALDAPVDIDGTDPDALARAKRLELLRIAARDLLGLDTLETVGDALAALARHVLAGAVTLARTQRVGAPNAEPMAVIGMGKLGARELNYASDIDVLFVTAVHPDDDRARHILDIARRCFRVDADLRPEGRAGPLTRPLDAYGAYWDRWAATWEFQALIKAQAVAGDAALGRRFEEAAAGRVWGRTYSADELAQVRSMKARAEAAVSGRRLAGPEIKRGPGGIRDVEFAVQLLQLVHGRNDPGIRERSTLGAFRELAAAGYVAPDDATDLADAYRFLRTVEHRLQLVEEEQTHSLPTGADARRRLARVMGFEDDPSRSATARFDDELRRCQRDVRAIHERLFFRPLLQAFAAVGVSPGRGPELSSGMSPAAVAERLAAFGFTDVARTRAAVAELVGGLTRGSRLMGQLLPLLLDWLSLSPDPDLGLLALRNLVVRPHLRALLVATFRESPEAARRLCLVLGSSRALVESVERNPELITSLADDDALAATPTGALVTETDERLRRSADDDARRAQLVRVRQDQQARVALRDILDLDDVRATGAALTGIAQAVLEGALGALGSDVAFCVVGMGNLGGAEMSYASDLDVLFVHDGDDAAGEAVGEALLHLVHGPTPAQRVVSLDLGLRPEGGQGRLSRSPDGYHAYFERWAQTWERQALVRARVVAGDRDLGARFMAVVEPFVWGRPLTEADVADIRRMKARIERERIPAREDAQFHLKLGKGSLSDVEWTTQLLQLRHGIRGAGTIPALASLGERGILSPDDVAAFRDAYVFCEHTRNRWQLVGALAGGTPPGDALPAQMHLLSRLARSLGTTPASLRDEYRRVTRRCRRVVERAFYGISEA